MCPSRAFSACRCLLSRGVVVSSGSPLQLLPSYFVILSCAFVDDDRALRCRRQQARLPPAHTCSIRRTLILFCRLCWRSGGGPVSEAPAAAAPRRSEAAACQPLAPSCGVVVGSFEGRRAADARRRRACDT